MPIIDHPEHALIGPVRVQRRHLAQSHGLDSAAIPADRLTLVHGLAHGETGAVREVSARLDAELTAHLIDAHRVDPDRMPPAAELERFHDEIHAITNPVAGHDAGATPAALAGGAQRYFTLTLTALHDVDVADHGLAVDMAAEWSAKLLRDFAPR